MNCNSHAVRPSAAGWTITSSRSALCLGTMLLVMLGLSVSNLRAAQATAEDGPAYPVSQLFINFGEDLPVHPPTKLMMQLDVKLSETDSGYVSARQGLPMVAIKLMDVPTLTQKRMHASAIRAMSDVLVSYFREWGYAGITVAADPEDIDTTSGKDIRLPGQTALRLVVHSMTGRGRPLRVGPIWETPDARDGRTYPISQFILEQGKDVEGHLDVKALLQTQVNLAESEQGMFAARDGVKQMVVRLVDVPKLGNQVFYNSALYDVCESLTKALAASGHGDLFAWPSVRDIDESGKDVRFANQTALRIAIGKGQMPERPVFVVKAPGVPEAAPLQIAPENLPDAVEADGKRYPVSQIILEYAEDHPGLPSLGAVMDTTVTLTEVKDGYVAPRTGAESNRVIKVSDLPTLPKSGLYGSAVRYIDQQLVRTFNEQGYIGVYVAPDEKDITSDGSDQRPDTQTALRVDVRTGLVSTVRTIAAGERVELAERVDNPLHQKIVANSPVQPGGKDGTTDLLRKDELDRYVYWLNRHPGRRVDLAVSPGELPGAINLDFLVTESKPWVVYAQASNTGTAQTDEWRERFGFVHNQLTNHDDVLAVDYITAGFEQAHAVMGSYEAPFFDAQRLRWRVLGDWSEFTASDVGFASEDFTGHEWNVGGDLIWNFFQKNQSFLDLVVGARWQNVDVTERTNFGATLSKGESDFFLPHVGLKYERITETATTLANLDFEINAPAVAGTDAADLTRLGRINADPDARALKWDMLQTFYLEPILNRAAWEDPSTPESSTLAHEIALSLKGQYAMNTRLNPQRERTVGGLYSVRGYDESITAADTAFIASAEYRFHLPRVFAPNQEPGSVFGHPFKWAPQYVFGRPDWDLILKGFVDYGFTMNSKREVAFEDDHELLSAGVGVELLLKRNFSIRVDWGYVLKAIEAQGNALANEGDNRFHVVGTILY